jgi:hypothetical protein
VEIVAKAKRNYIYDISSQYFVKNDHLGICILEWHQKVEAPALQSPLNLAACLSASLKFTFRF